MSPGTCSLFVRVAVWCERQKGSILRALRQLEAAGLARRNPLPARTAPQTGVIAGIFLAVPDRHRHPGLTNATIGMVLRPSADRISSAAVFQCVRPVLWQPTAQRVRALEGGGTGQADSSEDISLTQSFAENCASPGGSSHAEPRAAFGVEAGFRLGERATFRMVAGSRPPDHRTGWSEGKGVRQSPLWSVLADGPVDE